MKDSLIRDDRRPLYERAQSVIIARIMEGATNRAINCHRRINWPRASESAGPPSAARWETWKPWATSSGFTAPARSWHTGDSKWKRNWMPWRVSTRGWRLASGDSSQITHLTIREIQADAEIAGALGLRAVIL